MEKNSLLYYKSAIDLNFHPTLLGDRILGFEIKLGKGRYFFRGGETPFNPVSSSSLAANKFCMNKRLEAAGFPVPRADAFDKDEFKNQTLEHLTKDLCFPLVVKPTRGTSNGEDVLCNIDSPEALKTCMERGFKKHPFLSLEEFHPNLTTYRVLVFYNRVLGVVERLPARVVGDGFHSIYELIRMHNDAREKAHAVDSPGYLVSLGPIKIDEEVHTRLAELQLTLESVPKAKETIVLCYTCNSTRGGTFKSLGKQICKENARLLCDAANVLGLKLVGFDVACEDILTPILKSRGVIIEANQDPDVVIHEHPMTGVPVRVTKTILKRLILQHPLLYLYGLYKQTRMGLCMRFTFCILGFITFWQFFLAMKA